MYTKYEKQFYIFLMALVIFIIGLQIGIKHGRELQLEEMGVNYGFFISN